jgi:ABC-type amino acid transport substrate-binding protein
MLVDFPPYGTTNAQNQPDGYDADVAKLLANGMATSKCSRASTSRWRAASAS